jgi:hypothetical protein
LIESGMEFSAKPTRPSHNNILAQTRAAENHPHESARTYVSYGAETVHLSDEDYPR